MHAIPKGLPKKESEKAEFSLTTVWRSVCTYSWQNSSFLDAGLKEEDTTAKTESTAKAAGKGATKPVAKAADKPGRTSTKLLSFMRR